MSIVIKQELIISAEEEHAPALESTAISDTVPTSCALCVRDVPTNGNFFEYNQQNSNEFRDLLAELFGIELHSIHSRHFIVCRTCWKMLQMVGDFRECCIKGQSWAERCMGGIKSDDDWLSDEMTQMIDCLQAAIEDHMEQIEQNGSIEEGAYSTGKVRASEMAETAEITGSFKDDVTGEHFDYATTEDDSMSLIAAEAQLGANGLNTSKGEIVCKICNIPLKRDSLVKHKRSKRHRLQAKVYKRTQQKQVGNVAEMEPSAESDQSDWYEELNEFNAPLVEVVQEKEEPKDVECKICNMKFSRGANLDRHRLTKQHMLQAKEAGFEEELGYAAVWNSCTVCNLTFTRNDYYQKHLMTKRHLAMLETQNETNQNEIYVPPENEHNPEPEADQISPDQIAADQNQSNNAEERVITAEHKCRFCQCLYANAYQLEKHIHKMHFDNMLQCRVMCKKRFLIKKNLILHEKNCREKSLSCSFCKVKCSSKKAVMAHEKHFHSGTLWKCKYCDRKYKRRSDLMQHHLVKHGKEVGKHRCELCGKFFNTAKTLEYHQFTHTGTRPYSCEHCGKGFIYITGLNRHIRDLHKL